MVVFTHSTEIIAQITRVQTDHSRCNHNEITSFGRPQISVIPRDNTIIHVGGIENLHSIPAKIQKLIEQILTYTEYTRYTE